MAHTTKKIERLATLHSPAKHGKKKASDPLAMERKGKEEIEEMLKSVSLIHPTINSGYRTRT